MIASIDVEAYGSMSVDHVVCAVIDLKDGL